MNDETAKSEALLGLTADVVSAYVSNNPIPPGELPSFIASVNAALAGLGHQTPAVESTSQKPAVNPKKSVFPDYLISLEDGRKFKSMKRHLGILGMTPEDYRAKWNLPADYPMVAPDYAAARSALAKKMGLGRKPKAKPVAAPAKRGRKPKAA